MCVSQTAAPVSCSSYGLAEEETSWWVGVKDSKKKLDATGGRQEGERNEKGEKARGRKSIMWTKHTIHLGHLPVVCVCVCKGLYKGAEQPTPMYKYPRCCWWSREKGQSDSAHPYHSSSFSLSLPSIHPLFFLIFFSSSSSISIIFHVVTVCLLHGKNTEDLAWQVNYDLRLAWDK